MSESKEKGKAPSRTFGSLVRDEIQIQTIAVDMEGGMPSCTTLLDNFLMCYNIPHITTGIYRYGQPIDCGRKFDDFKFCMSVKGLSEEARKEEWIKRRAEWWAGRRLEPNSEDVWDSRALPSQTANAS